MMSSCQSKDPIHPFQKKLISQILPVWSSKFGMIMISDCTFLLCIYNRMKITAELIQQSPQFTNPLNERQLDLRGFKITQIQNMGATLNFFQCIDLSDNQIRKLTNFSYLDRLTSLILTNNRIKQLSDLSQSLPNIENIFLMNNKIADLQEVYKLATSTKLQRLVLVNNLVTELPNYRLHIIGHIPSLRIIDFQKVTKNERKQAQKLLEAEKQE